MGDTVLIEKRNGIAFLTLHRPDRANTVNNELRADLQARAEEAVEDDQVRAVIITGAGRHFCGGADLRAMSRTAIRALHKPSTPGIQLDWVAKPIIAAINGAAMGGGCEIALTCDFRLISAEAKIGLPEIRFGALPGAGGTARAPRVVGLAQAKRLIMLGEPIDAQEALRIGLVHEVVAAENLMKRAIELANVLASRAPYAVRAAKQLLNKALDVDLATALDFERAVISRMGTPEEIQQAQDEAASRSSTYANIFSKPDPKK